MRRLLPGWTGLAIATAVATIAQMPVARAEQWGEKDKLQDFVTRKDVVTNARQIDAKGLQSHTLATRPWSSTYWPDNLGSIAWRYTQFATSMASYDVDMARGWGHNRSNVVGNGTYVTGSQKLPGGETRYLHSDITSLTQEALDNMSPAEKYDAMMGDKDFTFWNKVVQRIDMLQSVDLLALWTGICHGWSPASLTLPRPKHGVEVKSPLGPTIKFYPDDIKALEAMLWGDAFGTEGNAQNYLKTDGWQCQTGAKRNGNGRLVDPRCADVNPAFFHLVVVNQIGLNGRGLIMDKDHRAGVWNQPTYAYKFSYYNLSERHRNPGKTLQEAKVRIPSRYWDPFANYRSKKAVALVGVEATLWYGLENRHPGHGSWTDAPEMDKTDSLTVHYDLELDANDEIVGGEWHEYDNNGAPTIADQFKYQHPDLVWLVPPGVKAVSAGDAAIEALPAGERAWDGNGPVPASWLQASLKATNKTYRDSVRGKPVTRISPQPLAKVVDVLLKKAAE